MSGPPGFQLANSMTFNPGPRNGCSIPIRCRGQGNYVLITNVPVQNASCTWHYGGRSGEHTRFQGSGRPAANIMVWHLGRNQAADSFTLQFYVGGDVRVPQIQCRLYCAPLGTPLPSYNGGWQPETYGR